MAVFRTNVAIVAASIAVIVGGCGGDPAAQAPASRPDAGAGGYRGCAQDGTCASDGGLDQGDASLEAGGCDAGYQADGARCADVDECATGHGGCDPSALCTNTEGSRTCACKPGYAGDGLTCVDVDECASGNGGCDPNATCTNTVGDRICACLAGFSGDGVTCVDQDECANGGGGCGENAACINTPGAWSCSCLPGFSGDGHTCVDVDECASGNGGCDALATCANTVGSRVCTCPAGYEGDGTVCADVDECAVDHGGCSPGAICTNTPGSRACACKSGYLGDGFDCVDVDECLTDKGGCAPHAVCRNLPGGFRCDCVIGFVGDGLACADLDECAIANGGCAASATCTNTPGSRECACDASFAGDGLVCPVLCAMDFPPIQGGGGGGGGGPLPDVDPVDVVGSWPLDGDFKDAAGAHDLTPVSAGGFSATDVAQPKGNLAYGPTGSATGNGALGPAFTQTDLSKGLTIEAWYYKPGNNTVGVLIGWSDGTYNQPELTLSDQSGFLTVRAGRGAARVTATFARPTLGCWYHLALVVPPGGLGAMRLFLDGAEATPLSGTLTIADPTHLFGMPFRLGTWGLPESVVARLDEARVWGRSLSAAEVALRAAPRGKGEKCPSTSMPWEPGPRCAFDDGDPPLESASTVRVITDDTVVFLTDPSDALEDRLAAGCGAYLTAMEAHVGELNEWWWVMQYGLAALDTKMRYLPPALAEWAASDFLLARTCGGAATPATILSRWTQPVSEWRIARRAPDLGSLSTGAARTTLVTWARLPFPLKDGTPLALRDRWGNRVDLVYDDDTTVSWALKLSQIGFRAGDPGKRALLGHFLGPAGPMDLSRFDGQPFQVVRESDGIVAFDGLVHYLADSTKETGETLWSLDFGALTTPGRYYVRLPGAGRTPAFPIGADALGSAFLAHARGLYHNRCAALDTAVTPWARGDSHQVYQAAFPPDTDDYANHAAAGWGFTDAGGAYVSVSSFDAVTATATQTQLPSIAGGWHDAGDFDRRSMHLEVARDLATAYLLAPQNFADGQLDLPAAERNNGLPDLLDEAVWGLSAYRSAQRADGAVGTWMEATSHPKVADPGADHQPYYLSLATRDSTLAYARQAALIARALEAAGAASDAAGWRQSAEAAWAFGTSANVHVEATMTVAGKALTWKERPTPNAERRLLAAVELWLATGTQAYRTDLESAESTAAFKSLRDNAWWQMRLVDLASVATHGADFPVGWGTDATAAIKKQGDAWRAGQSQWPYGWAWYPPNHGYVGFTAWGNGLYKPLRELALAWKVTGDAAYEHAAALGVAHLVGANGQGRSMTTGIGTHRYVTALDLPSSIDTIAEVKPGLTVYGSGSGLATQAYTAVWGLEVGARSGPRFVGANLTLLPPPWDNTGRPAIDAKAIVSGVLPTWRRMVPLEAALPNYLEFTVWETIAPAMFVTGLLTEPGWTPSQAMLDDVPLDAARVRESLWMMP